MELKRSENICKYCNQPFYSVDKYRRFCSSICKKSFVPENPPGETTKECLNCGKSFITSRNERIYCCRDCGLEFRKKQNEIKNPVSDVARAKKRATKLDYLNQTLTIEVTPEPAKKKFVYVKPIENRSCPECKTDFKLIDTTQIFCSEECRIKHQNKIKAIPAGKMKVCPNCKRTFTTLNKRKFCSVTCQTYFKNKKNSRF